MHDIKTEKAEVVAVRDDGNGRRRPAVDFAYQKSRWVRGVKRIRVVKAGIPAFARRPVDGHVDVGAGHGANGEGVVRHYLQGWCSCQWRAISMRRQIHTRSRLCTWSKNRASAAARPGRPASRQCRPMDIIFGCVSPSS